MNALTMIGCWLTVMIASVWDTSNPDVPSLLELRRQLEEIETSFQIVPYSAEIMVVDHHRDSAITRQILFAPPYRFREQTLERPPGLLTFNERLTTWDGNLLTVIPSREKVELRLRQTPPMPVRMPYGPVLEALQDTGSVVDFFTVHDTVLENTFEVSQELANNGNIILRRNQQLSGKPDFRRVELEFSNDRSRRIIGGNRWKDGVLEVQIKVEVLAWGLNPEMLRYSMLVQRFGHWDLMTKEKENEELAWGVERSWVAMERLAVELSPELFRPTNFAGNPMVYQFDGLETIRTYQYHPDETGGTEENEWSPLLKWILINDILLGGAVVVLAWRALLRWWRRCCNE